MLTGYRDSKRAAAILDFDDLLLYWNKLLGDVDAGEAIRRRFDCVLVDEYQDTNPIQAQLLKQLRPDGSGLTVVGDDAQSIYSFRGATVRNILVIIALSLHGIFEGMAVGESRRVYIWRLGAPYVPLVQARSLVCNGNFQTARLYTGLDRVPIQRLYASA